MNEPDRSVSIAPLIATVVIIATFTSGLWYFFWLTHDQSRDRELAALQAQLDQRGDMESGLFRQYMAAEEARRQSEQALLEARSRLESAQQTLARLQAEDWEGRYREAVTENYELSERITELELKHAIERDRLQAEHARLLEDHKQLLADLDHKQSTLLELQDAHTDLMAFHRRLERDFMQLEFDHDALVERQIEPGELQALQERTLELEQSLADKQRELQLARQVVAEAREEPPQQVAAAPPAAEPQPSANDPGYRIARLQSLGQAMHNRSSADRRSILIGVIPTIPGGIEGGELAELINGMASSDIAQVIQATRKHINTPMDGSSLEQIMANLDQNDAPAVAELLQP